MENLRYSDVVKNTRTGRYNQLFVSENGIRIIADNSIELHIEVIHSDVLRISYMPDSFRQYDHSYAIDADTEWPDSSWSHREDKHYIYLKTEDVKCLISKENLQLSIYNHSGVPLQQDKYGWQQQQSILRGVTNVQLSLQIPEDAKYFGLGDKPGKLQLRGQQLENWNSDTFAFGEGTDPMYRSVPFYYTLSNGKASGLFLDNSYRSVFDFGKTESDALNISTDGGVLNYYFIYGPELSQVAARYAQLTGRAPLPPIWALGFHQCRWSYYPESRVRELANTFRDLKMPCDSIYLDIDYMDDYRCFTWDGDKFPDPKGMVSDLKEQGFNVVVMIDPGIKAERGYNIFEDGMQRNVFCRRADGSLLLGHVWPGDCAFPDYTDPLVRLWWGELYEDLYNRIGISGFWNDMNEPAFFRVNSLTAPEDARHSYEGKPTHHAQIHNVYGMQMARASSEGLRRLKPNKRPFLLSRATFSGGQRYAALWTGDNVATWEHLAIGNRQCQRLSISGFSFCGTDIGGFVDTPSGELMLRWLQMGVFHPFFRVHSIGNHEDGAAEVQKDTISQQVIENRIDQEPWSFGEPYTSLARNTLNLRYRLMPYLYTLLWNHYKNGQSVVLPLAFYDQTDEVACKREREFMCGSHLLVSPVLMPGQREQAVYLPKGHWYNYHTGQLYEGGRFQRVETPLDYIPLFVKAGKILPHYSLRQHTGQKIDKLILEIYYAEGSYHSQLYEDAGDGFEYENEAYKHSLFKLEGNQNKLHIDWQKSGNYIPQYSEVEARVYGLGRAQNAKVNGEVVETKRSENGVLVISLGDIQSGEVEFW